MFGSSEEVGLGSQSWLVMEEQCGALSSLDGVMAVIALVLRGEHCGEDNRVAEKGVVDVG